MLAAEQICFLDEEREHRRLSQAPSFDTDDLGFYRSLMMENGDSMFIAGRDRIIEAANQTASELHGRQGWELIGMPCESVIARDSRGAFNAACDLLDENRHWSDQLEAMHTGSGSFPARVTIKKLTRGRHPHIWVIIRDLSEPAHLRKHLEQEKANRREMYQTLRNLVKSFEKERRGLEGGILNKIEGLLIPALDKIEKESCADIRNSYLNILRMELVGLTKGFNRELEAPLLKLTRTEMRVCRLIQKGYAGKEIAEAMCISFETVQVHRRNIRKKLGLTGRNVNLFAFLSSKPFLRAPAMT